MLNAMFIRRSRALRHRSNGVLLGFTLWARPELHDGTIQKLMGQGHLKTVTVPSHAPERAWIPTAIRHDYCRRGNRA
jgi:hypothetical protein